MSNRDTRGRFVKGHKLPGPGRRALAAEAPLIEGLKAACSAEKVATALDTLYTLGMCGNVDALKAWLAYAVGKPSDTSTEARLTELERMIGQIGALQNGGK